MAKASLGHLPCYKRLQATQRCVQLALLHLYSGRTPIEAVRPDRSRIGLSPLKIDSLKLGAFKICARQDRCAQICAFQVRITKISAFKVGLRKV